MEVDPARPVERMNTQLSEHRLHCRPVVLSSRAEDARPVRVTEASPGALASLRSAHSVEFSHGRQSERLICRKSSVVV